MSWMTGYEADPGCRNCDGTGVLYGNVCPCGCLRQIGSEDVISQEEFNHLNALYIAETESNDE